MPVCFVNGSDLRKSGNIRRAGSNYVKYFSTMSRFRVSMSESTK